MAQLHRLIARLTHFIILQERLLPASQREGITRGFELIGESSSVATVGRAATIQLVPQRLGKLDVNWILLEADRLLEESHMVWPGWTAEPVP